MAITTKELAKICHVSRRTVDRALHDLPGISTATKEQVLKTAKQYNYRFDHIASSLSRGRSLSIGVVLFDLQNPYFSQISNTISIEALRQGYFIYISVTEKNIEMEIQILNNLASRRVDGIILLPINQGDEYVKELKSLEIPIVTIVNQLKGFPYIHVNDFKAAYDSTSYIHHAGYCRICFICTPLRKKGSFNGRLNLSSQELRAKGYRHYMKKNPKLQSKMLIQKDFAETAVKIVRLGGEKTAFLCSSDTHAITLLNHFRDANICVPRDAGIMGFDNLDILDSIRPRLTTTSTSIETVGLDAINTLYKLINDETVPDVQYIPHLIYPGETI
jgi:DNA-binding LacI/PurR family transcriptional regulator